MVKFQVSAKTGQKLNYYASLAGQRNAHEGQYDISGDGEEHQNDCAIHESILCGNLLLRY